MPLQDIVLNVNYKTRLLVKLSAHSPFGCKENKAGYRIASKRGSFVLGISMPIGRSSTRWRSNQTKIQLMFRERVQVFFVGRSPLSVIQKMILGWSSGCTPQKQSPPCDYERGFSDLAKARHMKNMNGYNSLYQYAANKKLDRDLRGFHKWKAHWQKWSRIKAIDLSPRR